MTFPSLHLAFLLLLLAPVASPGAEPRVALTLDGKAVEVRGLRRADLEQARSWKEPEQWSLLFALYVERPEGKSRKDQPAVLGSYRLAGDVLRFEPRFPLAPGLRYRAVLHRQGSAAIETTLSLPKAASKPAVVEHVYPSRDDLPENQLRFYVHFSAAVSQGDAYRYIRLLDARGKTIDNAFLELEPELWSADGQRFTLLIDPGRIKRGLKPREDLGPVLETGKRYTLVIDRSWPDGQGTTLRDTFRKSFRAVAADDTCPDPAKWKLQAPAAGSREPLTVDLGESLDHALVERMLWVMDERGRKVPGTVTVSRQETRWQFTPAAAWAAGKYVLAADTRLEDPTGNSIGRPFEVDEERPVERADAVRTVKVPFIISN